LTEFTVANINRFVGVIATYWEIQAASSPQECCQLCHTNNQTYAATAVVVPVKPLIGIGHEQQQGWMDTNRMKDPCLYFTWVPMPAAPAAAGQQRRAAAGVKAGDGPVAVPGGDSPAVTVSDGPNSSVAPGAVDANQKGACLLIGGGAGWVDAQASKPGFKAVSGLLYKSE
jgi:hypothetical protein